MVVDLACKLDTLDGMGSVLASPPESVQNKNNGKAEMARESYSLGGGYGSDR